MANVTLTVQTADRDGVAPSYTAIDATDTYFFRNAGNTVLHFLNTGGSASTVTFATPGSVAGLAIADPTINVPATTGDVMAAMSPASIFADSSGDSSFTQDQASGVSVAVVRAE